MLNTSFGQCPYEDWERASKMCSPSENFHCLQDEFGRIGWLCTEPIWVEKGSCPVYNSGAKKLDSISCKTKNCPTENYRSNYVYIKNGCLSNKENIERGKRINRTDSTDIGVNKAVPIEYFAITAVAIIVLLAAIILVLYFKRRQGYGDYEQYTTSKSIKQYKIRAEQTRTPEISEVGSGNLPTSEHDEGEDINLPFLRESSTDTYTKARKCLATKRFVVLRGVQGSGKTYLANKLADNINQISKTECQVQWIHDVLESKILSILSKEMLVLDDIFYELQSKDDIQAVIKEAEVLFNYVCSSKSFFAIVTVPTLVWRGNSDHFQNTKCFKHFIDLDTLSKEEKEKILEEHLNQSAVKEEEDSNESKLKMRHDVKLSIINFERYDFIGYPSCVAWISRMQKEFDLHNAGKFIEVPITKIKSEIYKLRNSQNIVERKMFLLLAYMAFKDEKLNIREVDEDLFMYLARILFPFDKYRELALQEDDPSVLSLKEKYIRIISDGIYEFCLDVVRKIVFVVALERNVEALKEKVSQDMWKRVVVQREKMPSDLTVGELSHMFIKL